MKFEVGDRVSPTKGYWAGHFGTVTQAREDGWYRLRMDNPEPPFGTPWVRESELEKAN